MIIKKKKKKMSNKIKSNEKIKRRMARITLVLSLIVIVVLPFTFVVGNGLFRSNLSAKMQGIYIIKTSMDGYVRVSAEQYDNNVDVYDHRDSEIISSDCGEKTTTFVYTYWAEGANLNWTLKIHNITMSPISDNKNVVLIDYTSYTVTYQANFTSYITRYFVEIEFDSLYLADIFGCWIPFWLRM